RYSELHRPAMRGPGRQSNGELLKERVDRNLPVGQDLDDLIDETNDGVVLEDSIERIQGFLAAIARETFDQLGDASRRGFRLAFPNVVRAHAVQGTGSPTETVLALC